MSRAARPLRPYHLALALWLTGSPALAQDCAPIDALDRFAATGQPLSGAACTTYSPAPGAVGVFCHWSHPYRAASAQRQAAALWQALTACRAGQMLAPDALVNHPDSYELREWAQEDAIYALSVKDKAAQARTLVILRTAPNQQ